MKAHQKTIFIILLFSCMLLLLVFYATTESYWRLGERKQNKEIGEASNLLSDNLLLNAQHMMKNRQMEELRENNLIENSEKVFQNETIEDVSVEKEPKSFVLLGSDKNRGKEMEQDFIPEEEGTRKVKNGGNLPISNIVDQTGSAVEFQLQDGIKKNENESIKVHQSLLSNHISEHSRSLPLFLEDIIPSPDDHNIYQILTSGPGILKMRHYCSLESYCLQNPKSKVWFLMLGLDTLDGEAMQVLGSLEQIYPNLRLAKIDMNLTVSGTPLEPIVSSGRLKKSSFPANNLSDVIRMAVVAKAGGMYTDFDFICLRSVYELRNFVAQALPNVVMNGMFHFNKSHPFLNVLMEDDEKNFNGTKWAVNGPVLFSRVVKERCPKHIKNPTKMDINLETLIKERLNYLSHLFPDSEIPDESVWSEAAAETDGKHTEPEEVELCDSFKLLNTKAFMPFYYLKMKELFVKNSAYRIKGIPASSYGIHLFNKLTSKKVVEPNSGVEIIARVNCPWTFATCITEHRAM